MNVNILSYQKSVNEKSSYQIDVNSYRNQANGDDNCSKSVFDWEKYRLFSSNSKVSINNSSKCIDVSKKGDESLSSTPSSSSSVSISSSVSTNSFSSVVTDIEKNQYNFQRKWVSQNQMALELITIIGDELELIASRSDINNISPISQLFCSQIAPKISIHEYIKRIVFGINKVYDQKYKETNDLNGTGMRCLIMALIYIDRIRKLNPTFEINVLNIHRLILSSFMCALKFSEDEAPQTKYLSALGGVSVDQFVACEVRIMSCLKFQLWVKFEELNEKFGKYCIPNDINYQPSMPSWDNI